MIAQIVCHKNTLPQGAPTSPVVSNLISRFFDNRMRILASINKCRYTRYVDDLTFSTSKRQFPSAIAIEDISKQGWNSGAELEQRVIDAGFRINSKKTRMSRANSRQMVTGLVCNKFPNVPREYYLKLRSCAHSYITKGEFSLDEFCNNYADNCNSLSETIEKDPKLILQGRMQYVHYIKNRNDNRDIKDKQLELNGWWKLYQKFLFFRTFIDISRPLIVTEGITDVIYLQEALKVLNVRFKHLSDDINGSRNIAAKFFAPSVNLRNVLAIPSGSSGLKRIMYLYHNLKGSDKNGFLASISKSPVIFVTDNDEGLSSIKNMLNSIYKMDVSISKNDDFYHIVDNLYLVKTPCSPKNKNTYIEFFLPQNVLNIKKEGKIFCASNSINPNKHYGKAALAKIVKDRNVSADLVGMEPILDRVSKAVDHFLNN